jgi:carbon-monoxide dehydrogenase large subunit
MGDKGIGASLARKEDDRYMRGRGEFVGDIRLDRMVEAAFVRSPVAHGRIRAIRKPDGAGDNVFTAADLAGVRPVRAISTSPAYKPSDWHALALDKVRFVGECVAVCIAESRARAEDLARRVELDIDALPAVTDMLRAREAGAPLVHDEWADNVAFETARDDDIEAIAARAVHVVRREFRTARQAMVPIEGKGVVARWDDRLDQLICTSATQAPHMIRSALADALGLEERQVRVVPPDIGGGFGYKNPIQPEEIVVSWLAMRLRRPVRWTEDRHEHLTAGANAREHHYDLTLYADERGRMLALDAVVTIDAGAYSVWPNTSTVEGAMAGGILPGPYDLGCYRMRTYTVATNKPPICPYRSVARTGVTFAMDILIDALARAVGREPVEVRLDNLIPASAMPCVNITGKHYDSGDYPESLRRAARLIDLDGIRARQRAGEADGRLIGVGFATFVEQTAHGTSVFESWGMPMIPGFEQATARLTPDGGLELRIGVHSHGQGMETTMAQVANEVLGIDPARVGLVHGDTALTPYSVGTIASRSMVMAGGAVARACRVLSERMVTIGAHLLQCPESEVAVADGKVQGPTGAVDFAEIGRVWYIHPEELPGNVDRGGVEVTMGYRPEPDTGAFAYASTAVVVAVDPEIGAVEILDYLAVEDCGRMVNPMIVAGQIIGGTAQGIGTALYEESPYSETGQPLATTFVDYTMPGPTELPMIRLDHMETPSPFTEYGIKGVGESGAISPPATIANAINDALGGLGVELRECPMTPRRIRAAIEAAGTKELAT